MDCRWIVSVSPCPVVFQDERWRGHAGGLWRFLAHGAKLRASLEPLKPCPTDAKGKKGRSIEFGYIWIYLDIIDIYIYIEYIEFVLIQLIQLLINLIRNYAGKNIEELCQLNQLGEQPSFGSFQNFHRFGAGLWKLSTRTCGACHGLEEGCEVSALLCRIKVCVVWRFSRHSG